MGSSLESAVQPPLSGKAAKIIEKDKVSRLTAEARTREHMEAATDAFLRCQRELNWLPENDERYNPGYAELVVHFKGETLVSTYRKHGFEVEGGNGFYKATFRGKEYAFRQTD